MAPISQGCSGYSDAFAISDAGDLVGRFACGGGEDRAFVTLNGAPLSPLSLPGQYWSQAWGINSEQHITGTVEVLGLGIRAFFCANGSATYLTTLPNHDTCEGLSLNDHNIVVGYSANTQVGPALACRWIDGKIELLSLSIGPNSHANCISNNNQIVGWMGNAPGGNLYSEAFRWSNGVVEALSLPKGATSAEGYAININAEVCGAFWVPNPAGGPSISHPVVWTSARTYFDLGLLPGFVRGWAIDINDTNEIVGYCQNPPPNGGARAFIWRNGVMKAVETLIAPGSPQYPVWYAYGINNSGQIAASVKPPGSSHVAALLTPLSPHPGDTNCDWLTNIDDLVNVITAWNTNPTPVPFSGSPDVNNDGTVNIDDLVTVIVNWG